MQRHRYRSVFISDTHLGFRGAKAKHLADFLKSVECDYLYLVGDIFDFWAMKSRIWWNSDCSVVLRRILKMGNNGTKIVYIPGNHDEAIRMFLPFDLGAIQFLNETIHTTVDGKRLLVIHGDQFDVVIGHMKWLAIVGSTLYDWLLSLNEVVHSIRLKLGYPTYWSLAGYLKQKAKRAVSYMRDFETAVMRYTIKHNADGAVCGHIHNAKLTEIDGLVYANCGDWIESLTALVEHKDGKLEIINWHDNHSVRP